MNPCVTKVKVVIRYFGNNDTLCESCQARRGFWRLVDCAGRARFTLWEHDYSLPTQAKTREGSHTPIHIHTCVCTHVCVSYRSSSEAYCLWWHFPRVCGGRHCWKHVCSRCALAELDNYAQEMLKNENQLRGIVERVVEDKIFDAVKGIAKIEPKTVSQEEFDKLFK